MKTQEEYIKRAEKALRSSELASPGKPEWSTHNRRWRLSDWHGECFVSAHRTTLRKARTTGTRVMVAHNDVVGLESPAAAMTYGVSWWTICEEHGGCFGHRSRRLADGWAAHPEEWCPTCQDKWQAARREA